jgi:hypothetical protein
MLSEAKIVFVRAKRKNGRIYYYLVESRREGSKVRQKVIKYLGIEMPTKDEIETLRRNYDKSRTLRKGK